MYYCTIRFCSTRKFALNLPQRLYLSVNSLLRHLNIKFCQQEQISIMEAKSVVVLPAVYHVTTRQLLCDCSERRGSKYLVFLRKQSPFPLGSETEPEFVLRKPSLLKITEYKGRAAGRCLSQHLQRQRKTETFELVYLALLQFFFIYKSKPTSFCSCHATLLYCINIISVEQH